MRGLCAAIAAAALTLPCACGLNNQGLGPNPADAAAGTDAPDAAGEAGDEGGPQADAGIDAGDAPSGCVLDSCQGDCCSGCSTGGIFCPTTLGAGGTCVASCAQCQATGGGDSSTCYTCGAVLVARCESTPAVCPGDLDAGACPCNAGNPEMCPGPEQTCQLVDGQYVCISD